jgi:hypothetical protein
MPQNPVVSYFILQHVIPIFFLVVYPEKRMRSCVLIAPKTVPVPVRRHTVKTMTHRAIFAILSLAAGALVASNPSTRTVARAAANLAKPAHAHSTDEQHLVESYGKLPLSFEANRGQTDPRVKFLSRGSGYTLFLTGDEAVLSLGGQKREVRSQRHGTADLFSMSAAFDRFSKPRTADSSPKSALQRQSRAQGSRVPNS